MRDALAYPMPIAERISFLYFEKTILERDGNGLVCISGSSRIQVPVGRTTAIMLGPGVTASHAAISLCSLEGALLLWVGEAGVRLYGSGNPRSNSDALLRQARLRLNEESRLVVARNIYLKMFGQEAPQKRSVDQLRGIEGSNVKKIYEELANKFNVYWDGRNQNLKNPINAAISTATSALYGVTEAAILAMGYSPAIGFIHNGDARSFVFDVADIVKFKTVVPLAFELVATSGLQIEQRTRAACRDLFYRQSMPSQLVDIIIEVLDADASDRPTGG
jgi:CRISPR-associated protein Cas1